ncbi:MAG: hypothetical protein KDA96_04055, partial [Planctomycetaceae bacterium]|nr:hypothetical protein [Planctomycetaceae bacterium]
MSGNRQGWRGNRETRRGNQPDQAAAPGWKQSRRRATAAGHPGVPWMRILGALLVLLLFVGIAVFVFRDPPRQITLIEVLEAYSLPSESPPGREPRPAGIARPPRFLFENTLVQATGANVNRSLKDISNWEGELATLAESGGFRSVDDVTVILYLQTGFVPGDGGSLVMLNGYPGSPDVNDNEFRRLDELKAAIHDFCRSRDRGHVLLLVDTPPMDSPLRFGQVGATAVEEMLRWPEEESLDRLAVIAAASDQQCSWPAAMGAGGRTAFACFAGSGLTAVADTDRDQQVDLLEFAQFVKQRTEAWVAANRGPGLQTVLISPPLESLNGDRNARNFVLVKDPMAEVPVRIDSSVDEALEARLLAAWKLRDALRQQRAGLWDPAPSLIAADRLRRTELAYLAGDFQAADVHLSSAERLLATQKQTMDRQFCRSAAELSLAGQLPVASFRGLPSFPRLVQAEWWSPAPEVAGEKLVDYEDVLRQAVQVRRFSPDETPGEDAVAAMLRRRNVAEETTAFLFGDCHLLQKTVLAAEQELLESEDRFFIGQAAGEAGNDAARNDANVNQWQALKEFSETRRTARAKTADILQQLPGLCEWAGRQQLKDSVAELLVLSLRDPAANTLEELWQLAETEAAQAGSADLEARLSVQILRLLIATRGLASELNSRTDADAVAAAELNRQRQEMDAWMKHIVDSEGELQKVVALQVAEVVGDDPRQDRVAPADNEQHRLYHQCRSLMEISSHTPEVRRALLRFARQLDKLLAEAGSATSAPGGGDSAPSESKPLTAIACGPPGRAAILWQAQLLTLLPPHDDDTQGRHVLLSQLASELAGNRSDPVQLRSIGFGLRREWKHQREIVRKAARVPDISTGHLEITEFRSRLLPAYDAHVLLQVMPDQASLTQKLLDRFTDDYRELHVQRLLVGGWVLPDDASPFGENGWYRQMARRWTAEGREPAQSLGEWKVMPVRTAGDVSFVDGGEQKCEAAIRVENPDQFRGTAMFQVLSSEPEESAELKALQFRNSVQPVRVDQAVMPECPVQFGFRLQGDLPLTGDCSAVDVATRVFFRGRIGSVARVHVDPCEGKSWDIVRTPRSATANVVLQTADERPLAFVLDWSLTMSDPIQQSKDRIRANEALGALETIIDKQNEQRKASLRVFGHRADFGNPNPADWKHNPDYAISFADFELAEPLTVPLEDIPPTRDAQGLISREILNESGRNRFRSAFECLRKSKPYGNTPLVYALIQAVERDLQNQSGTIVAITDGLALDAGALDAEYPEFNQLHSLGQILERSRKTGNEIRFILISFDIRSDEEKDAIAGPFRKAPLRDYFTVLDASSTDDIVKIIDDSLVPPNLIVRRGNTVERTVEGIRGSGSENVYRVPDLPPGEDYSFRYDHIDTGNKDTITLSAGDHLDTRIDFVGNRFQFVKSKNPRLSVSLENDTVPADAPLRLAALAQPDYFNVREGNAEVEFTLLLYHDDDFRPVRQPAEVEFRYAPLVKSVSSGAFIRPEVIEEKFTGDRGTPGWKIHFSDWPEKDGVAVEAVWKMTRTDPERVLTWAELENA